MAKIKPFCGYLFNQKKFSGLVEVVTPPYDVISPQQQEAFYSKNLFNIIRIILGKDEAGDNADKNRYTRARDFLNNWIRKKILIKDEKPAIYFLTQEFMLENNIRKTRKGFIALLHLEKSIGDIVKGHERTFVKPIEDRLRLLKECRANLSQVFVLYSDQGRELDEYFSRVESGKPDIDFTDFEEIRQRMWRISDEDIVRDITAKMLNKKLFIADGHHRFQTSLDYQAQMRRDDSNPTGYKDYDYMMMYFTNMDDENLVILPTHRMVRRVVDFSPKSFLKEIKKYFAVEVLNKEVSFMEKFDRSKDVIGFYLKGNKYYIAKIKNGIEGDLIEKKTLLRQLPTVVLHNLILKKILKIEPPSLKEKISYSIDFKRLRDEVEGGNGSIAFYLKPTGIDQLKSVMQKGNLMPEKSTYFYPKVLTGLVLNTHSK